MDLRSPETGYEPEVVRAAWKSRAAGIGMWAAGWIFLGWALAGGGTGALVAFAVWYLVTAIVVIPVAAQPRRRQRILHEEWARRFHELAVRDDLTGLFNRRYFHSELAAGIEAARRDHAPLTLALVDLDQFKRINDTCGHRAGDAALRAAAAAIAGAVPEGATPARIGGDEFAVILPGTSLDAAAPIAEAIRAAIAAVPPAWDARFPLRVTVGLASAGPQADSDHLLHQADLSLYEGKRALRSRVA